MTLKEGCCHEKEAVFSRADRSGIEAMPVADLIRQVGIFGTDVLPLEEAGTWGCSPDQVRELKQLQEENGRLKKLVAELSLDKAILQDVASKRWPGPR